MYAATSRVSQHPHEPNVMLLPMSRSTLRFWNALLVQLLRHADFLARSLRHSWLAGGRRPAQQQSAPSPAAGRKQSTNAYTGQMIPHETRHDHLGTAGPRISTQLCIAWHCIATHETTLHSTPLHTTLIRSLLTQSSRHIHQAASDQQLHCRPEPGT